MERDNQFVELWTDAQERYLKSTDHKRKREDNDLLQRIKRLQNMDDLEKLLEKENKGFSDYRDKHGKVWTYLKKAANTFLGLSDIISTAVSFTPFAGASTIIGAAVFVITAANGVSQIYDWIADLFNKLGDFTVRLDEYIRGGVQAHLKPKMVETLTCFLTILAQSEKAIKDNRWKEMLACVFLGKDRGVKEAFDKLAGLFVDEERLVIAITYATNQRMDKRIEEIAAELHQVNQKQDEIKSEVHSVKVVLLEEKEQRMTKDEDALLEKHLHVPAYDESNTIFIKTLEAQVENSGEWLRGEGKFEKWVAGERQFLWISGGPGQGKSFLASSTISYLNSKSPQGLDHPNRTSVAQFCIKEYDERLRDVNNILLSIAYQITRVDAIFRNHTISVLSRLDAAALVATTRNTWRNLFLPYFKERVDLPNNAMIVIDGLDEAPRASLDELFELLEDIAVDEDASIRLSFAFFARPEISEWFRSRVKKNLSTIEIGAKNEKDITMFVNQRLKKLPAVRAARPKEYATRLALKIRQKVMAKADGMFFKVKLTMDQLQDKGREKDIFDAIEATPAKLEEMIAHVFERQVLDSDLNTADLSEILLWVSYAKKPLNLADIHLILKAHTGEYDLTLEARLRGRFASVFRVEGGEVSEVELVTNATLPASGEIKDDDVDLDDLDFDDLSMSEDIPLQGGFEEIVTLEKSTAELPATEPIIDDSSWFNFWKIHIQFTHASIRDFITNSRSEEVDRRMAQIGIRVDTAHAELHLATVCAQAILDYNPGVSPKWFVEWYAGQYLMDHILEINPRTLSTDQKKIFTLLISHIFFDEKSHASLIAATNWQHSILLIFAKDTSVNTLRSDWLANAEEEWFSDSPDEWRWIQAAIKSRREFFRPWALTTLKLWLERSKEETPDYFPEPRGLEKQYHAWIIFYFTQTDSVRTSLEKCTGSFTDMDYPTTDLTILDEMMKSGNVAHTAFWHAWYAALLVGAAERHDLALPHFEEALKLEPRSWRLLQYKARSLIELKMFEEAEHTLQESIRNLPDSDEVLREELENEFLSMLVAKKDYRAALEYGKVPYQKHDRRTYPGEADKVVISAVRPIDVIYIKALFGAQDYSGIVKVIEDFKKSPDGLLPHDITFLLRDSGFELGCALRAQGALSLIENDVSNLAKLYLEGTAPLSMGFADEPWFMWDFTVYMYHFYDDLNSSMQLLELSFEPWFQDALVARENKGWRDELIELGTLLLPCIYYQSCVAAFKDKDSPDPWLNQLRELGMTKTRDKQTKPVYKMNGFSQTLGVYLRRYGSVEDSTWKACFRDAILEGLDMLGDENPMNDITAYLNLFRYLLSAGDVKNAAAAAYAVLLNRSFFFDSQALNALGGYGFQKDLIFCDGICLNERNLRNVYKTEHKELHFCAECPRVSFCETCFLLLKNRTLPLRRCDPDHEFVQSFPVPEEAKGVAVKFDGKTLEVQKEWVDSLRKQWA